MTEKQFETQVKKFLKSLPATWYFKVWGGGYQSAGIPDLICCVNGTFVAVELKKETGKPTDLQVKKSLDIGAAGGVAYILKPSGYEKFKDDMEALAYAL